MLIEAYNIIDTQQEDFVEVCCDYIVHIKSWSDEYLEMFKPCWVKWSQNSVRKRQVLNTRYF